MSNKGTPITNSAKVTFREISSGNIHAILALDVSEDQKIFYPASNAYSIAEGHYPADNDPVWMRAIYDKESPVGFIMTSENPDQGAYFLWRIMIDENHQGRGLARHALKLLIKRIERIGNPTLFVTSHMDGNLGIANVFNKVGFEYTGSEISENDLEMRYPFDK